MYLDESNTEFWNKFEDKRFRVIRIKLKLYARLDPGESIEKYLTRAVRQEGHRHFINLELDKPEHMLLDLIKTLCHGKDTNVLKSFGNKSKIVLLIDDYDYLLNKYEKTPHFEEVRQRLENFFQVLEKANKYLEFVLISGESESSRLAGRVIYTDA